MLASIESLHTIHECCVSNRPLSPDLREWLASSLGRYLEHDCDSLNEAFGLVHMHGGVPWWRERGIRIRDTALRKLAREFYSDQTAYGRAKAVFALSQRYCTTSWSRDRHLDEMPARYRDTPKEYLWRAFRSEAKMPLSERRLRTLLAN